MTAVLRIHPALQAGRESGRAIVALESSVLAQGLPIPANREAADRMRAAVESAGALPAITAVVRGTAAVGITDDELERFLAREGVRKASARDLAWMCATGADAATTVAATLALARAAGLAVMATGGIGGVHREPPFDESADLLELSRSDMIVVCSGVKSILDLPATLERLETLGVAVIGYRTEAFPGFHAVDSGLRVEHRADRPEEIARALSVKRSLGTPGAILVVQPPPADDALPRAILERAIDRAIDRARDAGIRGAAVTPWVLSAVDEETGGRSRQVNLALLEHNARLAGEIATACQAVAANAT